MGSKKGNPIVLRNQIVNSFMVNGKKYTGEKILLKLCKTLQKSTQKNFRSVIQSAIISLTPAFKLNEQIMKKGKRKSKKIILSFIIKDSLRVMNALKSLKNAAYKNKSSNSFFRKLLKETLGVSKADSAAIEQKTQLQNQILLNKRYLVKFRW